MKALDFSGLYFEIGAMLALDTKWQNLGQILKLILTDDEVAKRNHRDDGYLNAWCYLRSTIFEASHPMDGFDLKTRW